MTFVGLPLVAVIAAVVAVLAAVVTLYLLKSTPRPQPVSNVDFWLRAMERAQPTWLFSRSIPLLAMLLTLLVALLIIFFAADPRLHHVASTTTVVVLDAGRTMGAGDSDERRIDQAVDLLEDVVAESARMGQVAVVRAGLRPSLLLPLTGSSHELGRALDGHGLDDGPSDLAAAISLADTIVARRRDGDDGRVILISDRHPATTSLRAPLTLLPVGRPGETVGIVAFGARRDPTAMGEYGVFCEVRAFTEKAAHARLVIRDRDVVIADEELEIEPGKSVTHRGRGFAGDGSEVTARLEEIELEEGRDQLAADDFAYAVVRPLARTRVLVVTEGNRFLEAVLRVNPSLDVERATPEAFDGGQLSSDFDVVIFDRHLPARALTAAGVMLVAPPRREDRLRFGPALSDLAITSAQSSHPVLDEVALEAVRVRRATPLLPEPEDRALFRSKRHVLATAREERGDRRVVFGFDFNDTDLVEGPAFPLMMHNAVVWLANEQTLARSSIHPGRPLAFTGRLATVELPSGTVREARGGLFFGTRSQGIYRVEERPQAVSGVDFARPLTSQPPGEARATLATEPPLSLILALLLLALIATEWFLFHRGRV